jgi:hypothetical protein
MKTYQFQSHDEDSESNDQPNWILSFANMMFLMFGLCAYLFFTENKQLGSFKNEESYPGNNNTSIYNQPTSYGKYNFLQVPEEVQNKLQEQKAFIDRLSLQTEKLRLELSDNKAKFGNSSDLILTHQKEKRILEKQIEFHISENDNLKTLLQIQEAENKKLVEKIKVAEQEKDVEQSLRDLKEKEVKRKEAQIKNRDSQLNQSNQNIEYTNNIVATQEAEISELRAQLSRAKAELNSLPQNLMFILKWSAPVDLDLSVTDPNGTSFDMKKRTIAGVDGKISVASATGPGSEIWESQQFIPGEYKIMVTYKAGQTETKRASGFVLQASSGRDSKESIMYTVDTNNKNKEITVVVDSKGRIAFK